MRNVIVFALGGAHYAVELRWVREVMKLGHVTPVPGCPDVIAGVVNFRGAIVPVLSLSDLPEARAPKPGDAAVLIEVEGTRAAFSIDNVHSVCTLEDADGEASLEDPQGGDPIPLLNPPQLIHDGIAASQSTAKEVR